MTRASRSPDITAGDIVGRAWLLVSAGVSYEIGLLRCPGPCTSHRLDCRPCSPGVPNLRGVGAHLSILRPAQPWTGTVMPGADERVLSVNPQEHAASTGMNTTETGILCSTATPP